MPGDSYPLNLSQPYPFEQWWVAAYSNEVGRELTQRKILDQPVVMYRTGAGQPVALAGLCPHRLYPLVKGRLDGDTLQCGYHGFTYDQTGRCVHIPSQDRVPANFTVRRYPLIECAGLIWIWTGTEAEARSSRLPELESMGLGAPGWAVEQHPVATVKARYQLLIDNLLDLSHISFIHSTSIPGGGAVVHLPCEILETDKSLLVQRVGRELPSNPHFRFLFPCHEGAVDQYFDTEFFGPNLIRTGGAIYASSGTGTKDSRLLGTTNFLHAITPESPTSVHYFVMTARNFRIDDAAIGHANLKMGTMIQPEDIAVIESIEDNVEQFASTRREYSVATDEGAIRARRRLAAQIRTEIRESA
ncbi:MAG TPA: aromatic ring-hydroxylating dioxygenase subunit alpha [Steroidobacteraceae bacterium]|jgi:vanillate O-demethylase monooxygenase subunit|nr:aromatic ring-hydroxylating dioxygenase subunit alpha [Steroidobacteraceae bacterium]